MEKEEAVIRKSIEKHMGYKAHRIPEKRCGNCGHGYVTNPGANIPGRACKIIEIMAKQSDTIHYVYSQVDKEGMCDFYK